LSDQTTSTEADRGAGSAGPPSTAKPSAMQGNEFLYGHLVAATLIAVAIANFVIRHGPGAPKQPQTVLQIIGLVAAVALLPILHTRNRFIAPFASVIAAFFVTFPRGPNSVQSLHVLAIIFPLVYALLLTQRQRKAAMAQAKAGAATRQPAERRRRRSRRRQESEDESRPKTPQQNRRYTPPKAKRAKR
jgi:hypothetical protein